MLVATRGTLYPNRSPLPETPVIDAHLRQRQVVFVCQTKDESLQWRLRSADPCWHSAINVAPTVCLATLGKPGIARRGRKGAAYEPMKPRQV